MRQQRSVMRLTRGVMRQQWSVARLFAVECGEKVVEPPVHLLCRSINIASICGINESFACCSIELSSSCCPNWHC